MIEPGSDLLRAEENILASGEHEAGRFHLGCDLALPSIKSPSWWRNRKVKAVM